jgi:methylglutaconyl-CoA hydratase
MNYVLQEKKDRIGVIILNRPDKRNALNSIVIDELKAAFHDFAGDSEVKVIILRASGTVFSAGADLQYLQQLQKNSYQENVEDSKRLKELFLLIYNLKKVVIAQVQGHAIAGGCGLMTVCDYAFAVPEAKFGYTEVKIGFIPAIVLVFLLRKISEARAKELLLSGQLIAADRAYEIGLVSKVVSGNELSSYTEGFATDLANSNSASSMGQTKQLISDVQGMDLESALNMAAETNAWVRGSEDCQRGIAAFLQGEKITW